MKSKNIKKNIKIECDLLVLNGKLRLIHPVECFLGFKCL
jgi:hypothetical protein